MNDEHPDPELKGLSYRELVRRHDTLAADIYTRLERDRGWMEEGTPAYGEVAALNQRFRAIKAELDRRDMRGRFRLAQVVLAVMLYIWVNAGNRNMVPLAPDLATTVILAALIAIGPVVGMMVWTRS